MGSRKPEEQDPVSFSEGSLVKNRAKRHGEPWLEASCTALGYALDHQSNMA